MTKAAIQATHHRPSLTALAQLPPLLLRPLPPASLLDLFLSEISMNLVCPSPLESMSRSAGSGNE